MNLLFNIRPNLFIILIIHVIFITCKPQNGYSDYDNKSNNRRSIAATKHPNAHYSRLVNNDFTQRNPKQKNSKDEGRTFGNHHPHHSGFPHSLHGHHHGHHALHSLHPSYAYQQQYAQYSPQVSNPCYYRNRGRSNKNNKNNNNNNNNNNNQESGRFLWDLNVYNLHRPQYGQRQGLGQGCDDLYSDPDVAPIQPQTSSGAFSNFVSLFSHGGAFNPYGGQSPNKRRPIRPYRPSYRPPQSPPRPVGGTDSGGDNSVDNNSGSNGDNGDIYDPVFENVNERPVYENQYQYADQYNEGPQLSPGQIVGGIAHTVNSVIQQLSGNGQTASASFLRRYYNMRGGNYYV